MEGGSIQIMVKFFTTLRELARTDKEMFYVKNGECISNIIENVVSKYGREAYEYLHDKSSGKIDPSIKFLINGVDVQRLQGFNTGLRDGDIIAIIPPIGGG